MVVMHLCLPSSFVRPLNYFIICIKNKNVVKFNHNVFMVRHHGFEPGTP